MGRAGRSLGHLARQSTETTMKATTLFAMLAASIGTLRSCVENQLHDDQKRQLDETVVALRDATTTFEEMVKEDVQDAVDTALRGGLTQFSERHDKLYGDHEERLGKLETIPSGQ